MNELEYLRKIEPDKYTLVGDCPDKACNKWWKQYESWFRLFDDEVLKVEGVIYSSKTELKKVNEILERFIELHEKDVDCSLVWNALFFINSTGVMKYE